MHRVVADNTHEVESFLNTRIETSGDESSNVIVDVFARKAKLLADFLDIP